MSNQDGKKQRTAFMIGLFLQDLEKAIAADDVSPRDFTQTWFVVTSFKATEAVIGFRNLPMSVILDICDLVGLKLSDYLEVEDVSSLPF